MANFQGTNGNDVIVGTDGGDYIQGMSGDDSISGGAGYDNIDGGLGNDTLDGGSDWDSAEYSNAPSSVSINLQTGIATGGAGTDVLRSIEGAYGSNFNDTLIGNADGNSLTGNSGNDSISGGAGIDNLEGGLGDDTLDGGDDNDGAHYWNTRSSVTVNLQTGIATGGAGTDILRSIERVTGSNFNDTLIGNDDHNYLSGQDGNDSISGGAGSDNLDGGLGNDTLDGGADSDSASFWNEVSGVTVNLQTGIATGGAGTDVLRNIENGYGSNFNDTLIGNDDSNSLSGYDGNDSISGGAGYDNLNGGLGNDTLDGGADSDSASFWNEVSGVTVNLQTGIATGGAGTDVLRNIENGYGSNFNDTLIGNDDSNSLSGYDGNDSLQGGLGDDYLNGGSGNNTIDGGLGVDTYATGLSGATINLATGLATSGSGDTDVLRNIENVDGSDGDDFITGDAGNNRLFGSKGSDNLYGDLGDDFLQGGKGIDYLYGGDGADIYWYSSGQAGALGLRINRNGGNLNIHENGDYFTPDGGAFEVVVGWSFGDRLEINNRISSIQNAVGTSAYSPNPGELWYLRGDYQPNSRNFIVNDVSGTDIYVYWNSLNNDGNQSIVIRGKTNLSNVDIVGMSAGDTTPPALTSFSPTDESTNVPTNTNIIFTFDEPILKSALGTTIDIHLNAPSLPVVQSYSSLSERIKISGNQLIFDPLSDLSPGTGYYVTMGSGAVQDAAGNMAAGITSYNFTTAATVPESVTGSKFDNFVSVEFASPSVLGSGQGNDTYLLSPHLLPAGINTTITDSAGSNSIQLAPGLSIASSKVASTALQLTLSNGSVIKVLGADTFGYEAGGNTSAGLNQADVSYATFVQQTLGVTIPSSGFATGGAVVIGGGSNPTSQIVLPVGSSNSTTAGAGAEIFYLDVVTAKNTVANTQPTLTGFATASDVLRLDLPVASGRTTLSQLNGTQGVLTQSDPFSGSTLLNLGNDADGSAIVLTLTGITDPALVQVEVV